MAFVRWHPFCCSYQILSAARKPYHFVNELSFLSYSFKLDCETCGEACPLATADAEVEENGAVAWEWSFERLKHFLANERETSNALSAYINHDLRAKLVKTVTSMADVDGSCEVEQVSKDREKVPNTSNPCLIDPR